MGIPWKVHMYKESQPSESLEPMVWWGVRKGEGWGKDEAGPGGSGQTIHDLVYILDLTL